MAKSHILEILEAANRSLDDGEHSVNIDFRRLVQKKSCWFVSAAYLEDEDRDYFKTLEEALDIADLANAWPS